VYVAYKAAKADAAATGSLEVPLHLRNAPTGLMKQLGYGSGYQYDHDAPDGIAIGQTAFPDALGEKIYYEPVDRGMEAKLREKLQWLREARRKASPG
jgi:putative ATPase